MAISIDAITTQTPTATGSFNHTCSGANRGLFVAVHLRTGTSADSVSVTYNSVSMSTGVSVDFALVGFKKSWIFYLANPSTGTNSVAYTFTGAAESVITAISFNGVNQANPISANTGSNTTTLAGSLTTNITTLTTNSWVLDAMSEGGSTPFTPGAGQTQKWGAATTINGMTGYGSTMPTTSPGATSTSWTFTGNAGACLINLEIQPSASVTPLLTLMGVGT